MSLPDVTDTEFEARVVEIRARLVGLVPPHLSHLDLDLDWVARQVAAAPPFTEEQRSALITLMAQRRVTTS